ncbi:hypothetical protein JUN65_08290 [Gluconacetobacter azotocaptans]|uniref:hypothetical protein n=1 Tax=Gluconacetobacter azotocaptans TaxID=142834 RepID=UPI00195D15B3|nr:hypothetical protein [Gluconacetobacter azotocaptans]MBM9401584.1 hypothetical protein [Gluconacetobacter azotocaptans]
MAFVKHDWTKLDPQVDALIRAGVPVSECAKRVGVDKNALHYRLRVRANRPQAPRRETREDRRRQNAEQRRESGVDRNCLRCQKAFVAPTRFIRRCPPCRAD